jgi:pimeloyl-ACP methyl ester carboxylesterase
MADLISSPGDVSTQMSIGGPTPLAATGLGSKILVVHGGPGFSHRYLSKSLSTMGGDNDITFYDQMGYRVARAKYSSVSFETCLSQFSDVVEGMGRTRPVTLIAHSWGCLVVFAACADPERGKRLATCISGGILVNPIPLERSSFDCVARRFRSQMSLAAKLSLIYNFALRDDGDRIMRLLLPFYGVVPTDELIEGFDLDPYCYADIMRTVGQFDIKPDRELLSRFFVIVGENDITPKSDLTSLLTHCANVESMPNVGHFPMIDAPLAFTQVVRRLLGDLKR